MKIMKLADLPAAERTAFEKQFTFSELKVSGVDKATGIITGMASTPAPDRMDDIVEPKGAVFKLPIPLLLHHDNERPIGLVTQAAVTKAGIAITATVKRDLLPYITEAWTLIEAGLIRGLSIGFRPLEFSFMENGGIHFLKWEWMELSSVTIPANAEATIETIKSADGVHRRAASGARTVVRTTQPQSAASPGVTGTRSKPTQTTKGNSVRTIAERIAAMVAMRDTKSARMDALLEAAEEDGGRTLAKDEREEYETLKGELVEIDDNVKILKERQADQAKHAANGGAVATGANGVDPTQQQRGGAQSQSEGNGGQGIIFTGRSNLPAGTGFVRLAMLKVASGGNPQLAAELAKRFRDSTPEVEAILRAESQGLMLKTAVTAGTTTDANWASPLVQYQNLSSEFVALLRPKTILGRMGQLRKVPFNVRIPRQTAGVSAGWVGEGSPKPVSKLQFDSFTMAFSKIAVIVAMTEELVRFSSPSAEAVARDDMIAAIAQFSDQQFISPGVAAVANVSPASITYGVTPVTSAGTSIANITTDVKAALANFITYNITLDTGVWIMHPNVAMALATLRTSQDILAFPDIDAATGGTFFGLPVIVSGNVPYSVSGGSLLVLVNQNDIMLADDGQVTLDLSREASIQMNDAPSAGAQSLVSFWQNNLVGLKAERFINWQARRTGAVAVVDFVHY
jgi:HK97 family phage major capsid protein/HK97 family phage prohead protease